MKRRSITCSTIVAGLTIFSIGGRAQEVQQASTKIPPLSLIQEIPLPGVQGRIDHFSADLKRERLFVSGLGNSTEEIVDVFLGRVIHTITGLAVPQGVLYVPESDRIVIANNDGKVRIYDGNSFELVKTVDFNTTDVDNIRYDAAAKKIYVGYGEDEEGAIGIIDAKTYERLSGDYKTGGGHPESFQLEMSGPKIFANDPDGGDVALAIDRRTHAVSKWQLDGNGSNFPMALDEANHRLFVGTRRPPKLLVFDTESGKLVTTLTCAVDSDDMFYDAALKRIYVIGGEGLISVIQQKDIDHYELIANVPSAVGARTGYYYSTPPYLGRLYVAVPAHADSGAKLLGYEAH